MNDVDDRIRAALHAAVDGLREEDLRPALPPRTDARGRRRVRWAAPLLAASAVAAVAVTTVVLISSPGGSNKVAPAGPSPTTGPRTPPTPTTPPATPRTTPPSSPRATATASVPAYNCYFDFAPVHVCRTPAGYVGYRPLWPFADYAQARQWQTVDGPNGHSPWHLDPKATALFFATGFLKFTDITDVTSSIREGDDAYIGVGYPLPSGQDHTAAVVHLVRFAPRVGDRTAAWEVVGAEAPDFTIAEPAYGSEVSSPMTVGGRITGSDENITVTIRTLAGEVDTIAPVAAGGSNAPWSLTVPFTEHGVIAVIASTGGHLTAHERFAVVGANAT